MADSALYTRTGDAGQTRLGQGRRVPKSHGTLEVLGNIDELESVTGLAKAAVPQEETALKESLEKVQEQLLRLKADLESAGYAHGITQADTVFLEMQIDGYAACAAVKDPHLLPGRSELSARLDAARSVARRLERSLGRAGLPSAHHQRYLNRLSDYLYAAARYADVKESLRASRPKSPAPAISAFTLQMAKTLLEAVEMAAKEKGLQLVMACCDASGHPMAVHAMDGAYIASYEIAVNKAWTAVSLKMPTKELAELCKPGGSLYGLQHTNGGKVVIFGGGVPLVNAEGRILGGFGVSGSTAENDTLMGDIGLELFHQLFITIR